MRSDDLRRAFDSIHPDWQQVLQWDERDIQTVIQNVRMTSGIRAIAPIDPFRTLNLVSPTEVRAVLIGQDPYPRPGRADGLAFSAGVGRPPSLRRVFDVLEADKPGWTRPSVWTLDGWARQGVLLLNTALTVEVGKIGSHLECGWQKLTSRVVQYCAGLEAAPSFLLWGHKAQNFFDAACAGKTNLPLVLRTRHPSNDTRRAFMADGSHFAATAEHIDWWALP